MLYAADDLGCACNYGWNAAAHALAVPNWVAGASSAAQARSWCTLGTKSFTGGPVALVQYPAGAYDGDIAC